MPYERPLSSTYITVSYQSIGYSPQTCLFCFKRNIISCNIGDLSASREQVYYNFSSISLLARTSVKNWTRLSSSVRALNLSHKFPYTLQCPYVRCNLSSLASLQRQSQSDFFLTFCHVSNYLESTSILLSHMKYIFLLQFLLKNRPFFGP